MTPREGVTEVTVECDCHTERVVLSWGTSAHSGGWIEMAFWKMGQPPSRSWRERVRHIWRIVRTGSPYSDFVALDSAEARRLAEGLLIAAQKVEAWEGEP